MYYVYLLKDEEVPFYIGMGSGDRVYSHEKFVKSCSTLEGIDKKYNLRKIYKINKILKEGRIIQYEIIPMESRCSAYELEKELISKWGRKNIDPNGVLTNIHSGGSGGDTFSALSDEEKVLRKKEMSKARIVSKEKRMEINLKIKETKMRNGTWGTTKEDIERIKRVARKNSIAQRIKIGQYSIDGELIKEWQSILEASKHVPTSQGSITNALDSYRKDALPCRAGGYVWKKII